MNIRFYNAKILTLNEQEQFEIIRGELWVNGDSIRYVGESKNPAAVPPGSPSSEKRVAPSRMM